MGLLDDAIREHLDLKRRRGADPTAVEREEREVLGPVRRRGEKAPADEHEPEFVPDGDLDQEPLPHDGASWEDGHAEDVGVAAPPPAAAFDHELIVPPEPEGEPYAATEAEPAPLVPASREPAPLAATPLEPPPFAAPEPEPHHEKPEHEPPAAEETPVEYNSEDAIKEEHPPRTGTEEDVLEETPDFLQDTPDHDRLWFEQRPPRDFDFDG